MLHSRLLGEQWLHEIKHDGFRIIARKDGKRVKLYSHARAVLAGAGRRSAFPHPMGRDAVDTG
jgi:hypothetical protein